MAAPSSAPSLGFRFYGDDLRSYFTIGGENASPAAVTPMVQRLQTNGFEVIEIREDDRRNMGLPNNWRGSAVFVQEHLPTDKDYTQGTDPGGNILTTFKTIRRILPNLSPEQTISAPLQALTKKINEFGGDIIFELQPHLRGIQELLKSLDPKPDIDDHKVAEDWQAVEKAARRHELQNEIDSLQVALAFGDTDQSAIETALEAAKMDLHNLS